MTAFVVALVSTTWKNVYARTFGTPSLGKDRHEKVDSVDRFSTHAPLVHNRSLSVLKNSEYFVAQHYNIQLALQKAPSKSEF